MCLKTTSSSPRPSGKWIVRLGISSEDFSDSCQEKVGVSSDELVKTRPEMKYYNFYKDVLERKILFKLLLRQFEPLWLVLLDPYWQ